MRYSKQRETVYNVLRATAAHPDVAWIYAEAQKIIPNIGLGTVYRNLSELVSIGKIKKISVKNSAERYDANVDEHAHFVCSRCGKIYDVDCSQISLTHSVLCVTRSEVTLYGVCSECLDK